MYPRPPDRTLFPYPTLFRSDEVTSGARTVLLVLLAASALLFIIACSNVANLILARTVRREGELSVRTALGASRGALRRMLLDRKSTRLNSSHLGTSYAVFGL